MSSKWLGILVLVGDCSLRAALAVRRAFQAEFQTLLNRSRRSSRTVCPPSMDQVMPDCLKRYAKTVLQAASVTPEPIGKPRRR